MIRKAFKMSVYPDRHDEYERRHKPIWPELQRVLHEHGVRSYSIYLDAETSDLFGYAEIESEELWQTIAGTEVCQSWWRHMQDLMPSNPDSSPIARELREVFHIEEARTPRGLD